MSNLVTYWTNNGKMAVAGLLITALSAALSGCTDGVVSGAIENRIEERLPQQIGPAKSYSVKVAGSTGRMVRGQLKQIDIHGDDVQLAPNLLVDALDIRMKDVVSDSKGTELKSVGEVTFSAVVSENALNKYLSKTRTDGLKVRCEDAALTVWAVPKVLGLDVNVKLTGQLVPRKSLVDYKVDKLQVVGLNAPSIAARVVEDHINPVMDLKKMRFAPDIQSVQTMPGIVRISGTCDVGALGHSGGR